MRVNKTALLVSCLSLLFFAAACEKPEPENKPAAAAVPAPAVKQEPIEMQVDVNKAPADNVGQEQQAANEEAISAQAPTGADQAEAAAVQAEDEEPVELQEGDEGAAPPEEAPDAPSGMTEEEVIQEEKPSDAQGNNAAPVIEQQPVLQEKQKN